MTTQKWFPLQHTHSPHGESFRVPWRIARKAWDVYAALGHGSQSCERLAERGGFSIAELIYLLAGENPYSGACEQIQSDFFNRFPGERSSREEAAEDRLARVITSRRLTVSDLEMEHGEQ